MKTLVFLFQSSPAAGVFAKEGLDALLAAAAFEQKAIPVFIGSGVWQLQTDLALNRINLPNLDKQISALPLYDVETLYVHKPSFEQQGVTSAHKNIRWLEENEFQQLLAKADQVLTF